MQWISDSAKNRSSCKRSARGFLSGECPTAFVRKVMASDDGYPRELYDRDREARMERPDRPEKFGGAGLGMLDMAMLLEEGGYAAMPGPFLFSSVLAARALKSAARRSTRSGSRARGGRGDRHARDRGERRQLDAGGHRREREQGRRRRGISMAPRCSCRMRTSPISSSSRRRTRRDDLPCSSSMRKRRACRFAC